MAEEFLALMADLDEDSQKLMSGWYQSLTDAGFCGIQSKNLPFHVTLGIFPPEKEDDILAVTQKAASEIPAFPVRISHIGMFPGGKVLFAGPERDANLNALHEACETGIPQQYPWTPHVTLLMDEPETIQAAIPLVVNSFEPFVGKITALHLCAFCPRREIATIALKDQ